MLARHVELWVGGARKVGLTPRVLPVHNCLFPLIFCTRTTYLTEKGVLLFVYKQ